MLQDLGRQQPLGLLPVAGVEDVTGFEARGIPREGAREHQGCQQGGNHARA